MNIYTQFEQLKNNPERVKTIRNEILATGDNVLIERYLAVITGVVTDSPAVGGIEARLTHGFTEGDLDLSELMPIKSPTADIGQVVEEYARDLPSLTQAYLLSSLDDEGLLRVYYGLHNISQKGLKNILNPDEKVQLPAGVLCYKRHLNQVKIPDSTFKTAVQYLTGVGRQNLSGHLQLPLERYQKMFNIVPLGVRLESVSTADQEAFLDSLKQPLQVRQHKVAAGEYSGDFWAPTIRKSGSHFNSSTRTDYAREIVRLIN